MVNITPPLPPPPSLWQPPPSTSPAPSRLRNVTLLISLKVISVLPYSLTHHFPPLSMCHLWLTGSVQGILSLKSHFFPLLLPVAVWLPHCTTAASFCLCFPTMGFWGGRHLQFCFAWVHELDPTEKHISCLRPAICWRKSFCSWIRCACDKSKLWVVIVLSSDLWYHLQALASASLSRPGILVPGEVGTGYRLETKSVWVGFDVLHSLGQTHIPEVWTLPSMNVYGTTW